MGSSAHNARRWWVWRVAACAALGAGTTVAVAWCLSAFLHTVDARPTYGTCVLSGYVVEFSRHESSGLTSLGWEAASEDATRLQSPRADRPEAGPLPSWSAAYRLRTPLPADWTQTKHQIEVAAGWPLRAMVARLHGHPYQGASAPRLPYVTTSGIGLPELVVKRPNVLVFVPRALPVRPTCAGLAANTAVFGAAWWVVLAAPGVVRRWGRRRSGVCEGCGYDLRGLREAGCPECGRGRVGGATDRA